MRHFSLVVPFLLAFSSHGHGGALGKLFCPTMCNPNPKEPLSTCFYKCGFLKYGKYFDGSRCWYLVGTGKIINSKGYCNRGICLKVFTTGYEGSPAQRNCEVHQTKVPSKGETGVKGSKFNVTQASEHWPSENYTKNATTEWHRYSLEPTTPARTPDTPYTKGGLTESYEGGNVTLGNNAAAPSAGLTTAAPSAELMTTAPPVELTKVAQPEEQTMFPPTAGLTSAVPPAGITTVAPPAELTTPPPPRGITTAGPLAELMTVAPPTRLTTVASLAELMTVAPPAELTTSALPAQLTAATPPAELKAAPPAHLTMAAPPTGLTTGAPPAQLTTAAPPAELTKAAPPAHLTTVAPPTGLTTAAPLAELTTATPPAELPTATPPPELTVEPPAGITVVAPPAQQTTVAPPAEITTAAPPVQLTTTVPAAGRTTTALPAELTTVAAPGELTTIAAPAGITMVAPPAGPTTATPPAGITTAPPPAKLLTFAPPSGFTEAQASTDKMNAPHAVQATAATSTSREHIEKATKEGFSLSTLSPEIHRATEETTMPPGAPSTTALSSGSTDRHQKGTSPKEAEISTATTTEMPVNTEQSPTIVLHSLTPSPAAEHGPTKYYATKATTEWPGLSLEPTAPATPPNIQFTKAHSSEAPEIVTVTLGTSTAAPPVRVTQAQASTHDQKNASVQATAVTSASKEHINTTAKEGAALSTSSQELALTTEETTVPMTTPSTTVLSPGSTDKPLKGTRAEAANTSLEKTSEAAEKITNTTVSAIVPQATTPPHVAQNVSTSASDNRVPMSSTLIALVIIIANYYCFLHNE